MCQYMPARPSVLYEWAQVIILYTFVQRTLALQSILKSREAGEAAWGCRMAYTVLLLTSNFLTFGTHKHAGIQSTAGFNLHNVIIIRLS